MIMIKGLQVLLDKVFSFETQTAHKFLSIFPSRMLYGKLIGLLII